MVQNLALVSLEDLEGFVIKHSIKNEVWKADEAARYLKCSPSQIKKQATEGVVPGVKVGTEWRFSSIALFEFVYGKELKKKIN
ncbi:helix-turn-helix domain-containing protein [uncultured Vagococcus sp.]|uniref:helix-turn-helix domain-containing protein n=1 Tax=uncultured Vagococcus sp. TaxID=189676 RepID=UPI00258B11FE|nr:helix-turn-helix domain-containing protein [uncultured Vagococcus sp.]